MKHLKTEIERVRTAFHQALSASATLDALEQMRVTFLGRKGEIAFLMPLLKDLSQEDKREFGPLLNVLKEESETAYFEKREYLQNLAFETLEEQQKDFDVTADKPQKTEGSLHLYTQATQRFEDIFISLGYTIADGPEAETEFYNFEALNIPENHPARDMQDTFFLNLPNLVLRTHTSPVQIRTMLSQKPPLAIASLGRVFRYEATDASHDFMFRQLEGLVVDKNISVSQLLGTIRLFLGKFFEKDDLQVRARPGYFPFVEPGLEVDMSCPFCTTGCSTCSHTRWVEMGGAGLVHPRVLQHGGIDPKEYSGFAFGFGVTRLVMFKYGISDIRLLHSAEVEFLKQF